MELPDDIVNLLIAADPARWLDLSKAARQAALAAISAAITPACNGIFRCNSGCDVNPCGAVSYRGVVYAVRRHTCLLFDVTANWSGLCDICTLPYTRCTKCIAPDASQKWITSRVYGAVRVHYCEMILIIIAAARGRHVLPDGFGVEISHAVAFCAVA